MNIIYDNEDTNSGLFLEKAFDQLCQIILQLNWTHLDSAAVHAIISTFNSCQHRELSIS